MDNPNNPANPYPQYGYPPQAGQPAPYGQPGYGYPPQPAAPAPYPPQAAPPPPVPGHSVQAQNPAQYGLRVVDSLSANEFRVEINGQTVTGVFSVAGLCPFSIKVDDTGKPIGLNTPPLVLTKMVQQDPTLPFNAWVREAVQARGTILPTREITVVALDEGVETRRWVYRNAWVREVTFSDFDTALDYLVEEKITLHYQQVEEIWPQG